MIQWMQMKNDTMNASNEKKPSIYSQRRPRYQVKTRQRCHSSDNEVSKQLVVRRYSSYLHVLAVGCVRSCLPRFELLANWCNADGWLRWRRYHCSFVKTWSSFPTPWILIACYLLLTVLDIAATWECRWFFFFVISAQFLNKLSVTFQYPQLTSFGYITFLGLYQYVAPLRNMRKTYWMLIETAVAEQWNIVEFCIINFYTARSAKKILS
jgi:hypothetical protein